MYLKYFIALSILMISCSVPSGQRSSYDKKKGNIQNISDEFVNPPMSYRPGAFWCWLNGNMSATSITRDLEAMKSKGINREKYQIGISKTNSIITIDGILDEAVWSSTETATHFQRVLPTDTGFAGYTRLGIEKPLQLKSGGDRATGYLH